MMMFSPEIHAKTLYYANLNGIRGTEELMLEELKKQKRSNFKYSFGTCLLQKPVTSLLSTQLPNLSFQLLPTRLN
jgi:hypothetical protein